METSPLSPSTQVQPIITASSTLKDKAELNTQDKIELSSSTKKIDKVTEKIYSFNSRKQDSETAEKTDNTRPQVERQIVYLDSSNSTNQTVYMTNNAPDIDPNNDMVTDQVTQLHTEPNPTGTPVPDAKSLVVESNPKPNGNMEQLQMEKAYSRASSLTYKTAASSAHTDSISDLNEEGLQALNEIPWYVISSTEGECDTGLAESLKLYL